MNLKNSLRTMWEETKLKLRVAKAGLTTPWNGDITPTGRLFLTKISPDGTREDLGLVSTKVVTTAAVNFLRGVLDGTNADGSVFNQHASGTGTAAEAIGNTALGTEVASRVAGTQTQGASANIYRTVATISYAGGFAITEHGVFSASSGGTLLDRSVFSAINVISGDSIEFTYELTLPAGS